MARRLFGYRPSDFVTDAAGTPIAGAVGTVWTLRVGGNQLVDLLDRDNASPIDEITADSLGNLAFYGPPDGTSQVWVDFGAQRFALDALDVTERLTTLEAGHTVLVDDSGPYIDTGP